MRVGTGRLLRRAAVCGTLGVVALACGRPADAPSAAPSAAATPVDILATGTKLYSQSDEELIIRDFFQDRREGFFLDVGCASPIENSNTYYLESRLGWSGIGVDALPEFQQAWARKRPRSRFFNFYVSDHSDTVEPFYRSEHRGTSSARKDEDGQMKGPGGKIVRAQELQVPTITLDKLLDAQGVKRLDFMSMDIEGFEPVALAGFDIARFRPRLVCIEAKPAVREQILAYFAGHDYERIERYLARDQVNYYFKPKAAH